MSSAPKMLQVSKLVRSQVLKPASRSFSVSTQRAVSAPGPKDGPKGNATGLKTDEDGMKSGVKDNTSKTPVDKQANTPNVEVGGEGAGSHPAKQAKPQPEPTRSTGIKGKEEMG